ncbi:MAG: carbohydrate porin [Planctomycetota bacterium]|jgi:hypothetical protein
MGNGTRTPGRSAPWPVLSLAIGLIVLAGPGVRTALAQEPVRIPAPSSGDVARAAGAPAANRLEAARRSQRSGTNPTDILRSARVERRGLLDLGLHARMTALDDALERRTGIRFALAYTQLYQHATNGDGGPRNAWGAEFDIVTKWALVGRKGCNQGLFAAVLRSRYKIDTHIPPSEMSNTIDSLWPTTSGFNEQDFTFIQVYWQQDLLADRMRIVLGKIDPSATFFGNRFNSSKTEFVNNTFSSNPAVFFPGNGAGLHARYRFSDRWEAVVGVQDANGKTTAEPFSTLGEGELWVAGQVQFTTDIRGLGRGHYRLGGWRSPPRSDAGTPAGAGTCVSIDQEFGRHVVGFLRVDWQGEGLVTTENRLGVLTATRANVRGGVVILGPIPALPDDELGIGAAWGEPEADGARDAWVGEVFYRLQATDSFQITPSFQVIRSLSRSVGDAGVFSLRFRLTL